MDVTVIGIRDRNKTSGHLKNYKVSDLLKNVDIILSEHGFIRLGDGIDVETRGEYRSYQGVGGDITVRYVTDDSRLIPYFKDNKLAARCPVYMDLIQVPDSVENSILNKLKKI
jgi:hypothetical protein